MTKRMVLILHMSYFPIDSFMHNLHYSLNTAVKKKSSTDLYLNSKRRQKGSSQFVLEGTKFRYSARGAETLTARGPLLGDVEVMVSLL